MATKSRISARTATLEKQRKIQAEVDRADKKHQAEKKAKRGGIQTGARKYPVNPMPKQHQQKPGLESEIEPRPMFRNPAYRGSGKLEDMVALITGGDSGIGRAVVDPTQNSLLSDYYPVEARADVYGFHRMSLAVGSFFGLPGAAIGGGVGAGLAAYVLATRSGHEQRSS